MSFPDELPVEYEYMHKAFNVRECTLSITE